jgi:hypothetical protein
VEVVVLEVNGVPDDLIAFDATVFVTKGGTVPVSFGFEDPDGSPANASLQVDTNALAGVGYFSPTDPNTLTCTADECDSAIFASTSNEVGTDLVVPFAVSKGNRVSNRATVTIVVVETSLGRNPPRGPGHDRRR